MAVTNRVEEEEVVNQILLFLLFEQKQLIGHLS